MSSEGRSTASRTGKVPYSDSSGAIFSMYLDKAQKVDDDKAENWRRSSEGILVFTGLFSGTVASFILSSYQNLQPDPDVITQSLLAQISRQLANPSSAADIPSASDIISQSSFRPSRSAVAVNSIWFLSLTLSLTCALGATLMQQWTLRYLQITRRNHAPHTRACIRGYLARGVDKFRVSVLVEALPTLLLASIFLFFVGLVIFIFDANHTVAFVTVSIVAFSFVTYIALTIMPLFFHDSPYLTPLSPFCWYWFFHREMKESTSSDIWGTFRSVGADVVDFSRRVLSGKVSEKMISMLEKSAKKQSLEVYREALEWTADHLDEDHEFEEFVAGIPGLYRSKALQEQLSTSRLLTLLRGPRNFHPQLSWSIIRLARRTTTGDLQGSARSARTKACVRALYHIPGAIYEALAVFAAKESYCLEILPLINTAQSMRMCMFIRDAASQDTISLSARCVAAVIAAFTITKPHDFVRWSFPRDVSYFGDEDDCLELLFRRLGVPKENVREYLNAQGGDSARLGNLISFLHDIMQFLGSMHQVALFEGVQSGDSPPHQDIHAEREALYRARHSEEYIAGTKTALGNRNSPAYISAAQYDLIRLTLEILIRNPVKNAAHAQRNAFADVVRKLRAKREEVHRLVLTSTDDSIDMVLGVLTPVLDHFSLSSHDDTMPAPEPTPTPQGDWQVLGMPIYPGEYSLSGSSSSAKTDSRTSVVPDPNELAVIDARSPASSPSITFPIPMLPYTSPLPPEGMV